MQDYSAEIVGVKRIYAVIITHETNVESLGGFVSPEGWLPMISSNRENMERFRDMLVKNGRDARVVSFVREE